MKLTATQLRRIIKEEVSKVTTRRSRLSEGHARITEEEFAQWKSGNWGFVAEDHHGLTLAKDDDSSRFLHGSDEGHPMDDEGYMVKSRMASMKKMAAGICDLLDSDDQLPAWVQDLVATSHNDLQHVHDYLMGDEEMRSHKSGHDHDDHMLPLAHESRRLREKQDLNKDGENDFEDVMIARMQASGMDDEKAIEKGEKAARSAQRKTESRMRRVRRLR